MTLRCLPGLWFSCKVTCVGDSIKMAKFLGSAQGVCTVGQTGPFIQESQLQHKTHGRHTTPGAVPEFRCVLPFQEGLRGPRLVLRRRRPGPEQLQRPVPQVGDRSAARSTWRLALHELVTLPLQVRQCSPSCPSCRLESTRHQHLLCWVGIFGIANKEQQI